MAGDWPWAVLCSAYLKKLSGVGGWVRGWANSVLHTDEVDQCPIACTLAGNTEAGNNAGTWCRAVVYSSAGFPPSGRRTPTVNVGGHSKLYR